MNGFYRSAAVVLVLLWTAPCSAEPGATRDSAVEPATATESRPSAAGERIKFQQQPTHVGDRVVQRVGVDLQLTTKVVQSGQVAHEGANQMRRQQQRTVDVLEVIEGRAVKTKASFQVSRKQSPENPNPDELAVQPIEGKTYLASRTDALLSVTDEHGAIPPRDEFLLVMESLDSVGKTHPLAELLTGRTLAVGERLHVPRDLARTLLNMGDTIGTIKRFELTFDRKAADKTSQAALAVFKANIELTPDDKSPLGVTLAGEIAVDPASCRMIALDLAGPVGISTIEKGPAGIYQFSAAGQLRIAMRASYGTGAK